MGASDVSNGLLEILKKEILKERRRVSCACSFLFSRCRVPFLLSLVIFNIGLMLSFAQYTRLFLVGIMHAIRSRSLSCPLCSFPTVPTETLQAENSPAHVHMFCLGQLTGTTTHASQRMSTMSRPYAPPYPRRMRQDQQTATHFCLTDTVPPAWRAHRPTYVETNAKISQTHNHHHLPQFIQPAEQKLSKEEEHGERGVRLELGAGLVSCPARATLSRPSPSQEPAAHPCPCMPQPL